MTMAAATASADVIVVGAGPGGAATAHYLAQRGLDVVVTRESAEVSWIEVAGLRLRGYAVSEGASLEAINFELNAPESDDARRVVFETAEALGWDVSEDEEGELGEPD